MERMITLALGLALIPVLAFAEDGDLGSDDPALQQTVASDEELGQGQVVLDTGHIDLGPRYIDGEWTLLARDDTAALTDGRAVWRDPDDVVFKVNDLASLTLPDDEAYAFTGAAAGEEVWVIPQTELAGVVWLGWNTQDPEVVASVQRGVTLEFLDVLPVDNDGRLTIFLEPGNFAPPQVLYEGQPSELWVELNTHTHVNWVFTEPGTYLVRMAVKGEGLDQQELHSEATLRLSVGDAIASDAAFAAEWPMAETSPATAPSRSASAPEFGETTSPVDPEQDPQDATEDGSQATVWIVGWVVVLGAAAAVVAVLVRHRRSRIEQEVFGDDDAS